MVPKQIHNQTRVAYTVTTKYVHCIMFLKGLMFIKVLITANLLNIRDGKAGRPVPFRFAPSKPAKNETSRVKFSDRV